MRIARRTWLSVFLLTVSVTAIAAIVSIDSRKAPYNQVASAEGVGASDVPEVRQAGMLGLVGMYRVSKGINSLPNGSVVTVIWNDGSTEKATIICQAGSACVQPIPGSVTNGDGGGGGGGGGSAGGGGGGGFGGDNCSVRPRTRTACSSVNGVNVCQTFDDNYVDCGFG